MSDEELQKLWQSQRIPGAGARDMSALLATAREQHRKFRRTIFWRDVREVAVAAVMLPVWCWLGVKHHEGWLWYLMIPALLFVAGYLLMSRWQQHRDEPRPGDSVAEALGKAVRELERQIRLLESVLWWYLAPILGVLVLIDADRWWRGQVSAHAFLRSVVVNAVVGAVLWGLNRRVVRKSLAPRRAELRRMAEEVGGE